MSKDKDRDTFSKLWSGETGKQESPSPPKENVIPMGPPPAHEEDEDDYLRSPLLTDSRVYIASANRKRPETLILHCVTLPPQAPTYSHLLNIALEMDLQSGFTLYFPFMKIQVQGHRLLEVFHAINARRCAIIREFHPDRYDRPRNREAPMVERIAIEGMDS